MGNSIDEHDRGRGMIILEAAACRTPAVAYNVPGFRDSVKHMETGILVELGSIEKLVKTITWLLTDDNLRNRLAENAYEYARQFSWDSSAEKFASMLGCR